MSTHGAYLWEAVCVQPDCIILQERGGWKELFPIRNQCIALRFKPQRSGFRPVVFDLRPEQGFCLEWVGWENDVAFAGGPFKHTATNKIKVRQYFEVPDGSEKKRVWFEFYYYVTPTGVFIVSPADMDKMMLKMTGLLDG